MQKKAHLIAFVGLDGSGKTTQANLLVDWLRSRGYPTLLHPNESLQPVKRVLSDIARDGGYGDMASMLGLDTAQLMIALIKWNTMAKVDGDLAKEGQFVIMDRYSYCQIAAAKALGIGNAWLIERLYASFPPPDLTLMVDIAPTAALQRLTARNTDAIPLTLSFLEGHHSAYRQLPEAATFTHIDGARSIDNIRDRIRDCVATRFPFLSSQATLGAAALHAGQRDA